MKDKMKKFLATLLAVALVAVACCVFASAEDTNLALNKSYTTIGIFTEKGKDTPSYPDEGNKSLTDGVKSGAEFSGSDVVWAGFNINDEAMIANGNKSEISVDLGAVSKVSSLAVEVIVVSEWGVTLPKAAEFLYSADGNEWTSAGEGTIVPEAAGDGVYSVSLKLNAPVDAKYVKVQFVHSTNWLFVSEFEAFGTTGAGTTDESKSETESKTESEAVSSAAPVESSAAATSSTASSTPSTSDAGVFAVVVLAVVAVIGAAVVVKKRA